jgi:hypothetical protein
MNLPPELEGRFRTLGFSEAEAKVYLSLLSGGEANGSRLAAACGLARTTAYAALEALLRRGAVLQTLGEPRTFRARPPGELFEELATRAVEDATVLAESLAALKAVEDRGEVWNVSDEATLLSKALGMIGGAEREILVNSDHFMVALGPTLEAAARRGVKVFHFSYSGVDPGLEGVLTVCRWRPRQPSGTARAEPMPVRHRLMLVADMASCLTASREASGQVSGIATADSLLVHVMAEHIHHDIYLARIAAHAGTGLSGAGALLGSLLEAESRA